MKFVFKTQKGSGRGRSLGFPTMNFDISQSPPEIPHGIYACFMKPKNFEKKFLGALFYGPKEMFGEPTPSFEAYVIENFSEIPNSTLADGNEWEIEVHQKIRDVKKFDSEDQLKAAIKSDLKEIQKVLHQVVPGHNNEQHKSQFVKIRTGPAMWTSSVLDFFRDYIHPQNPFLLLYHRIVNFLVALLYGFPARKMKVIAVTGTKGKTTTVYLISKILEEAGKKVGSISSILIKIGEKEIPNNEKISSFSRIRLQKMLKEMKNAGCEFLVIEVTSHALAQSRIAGIPVDCAVLTNLSGDHIEYHGSFESYRDAKANLFKILSKTRKLPNVQKISVLPKDDPNVSHFEKIPADKKIYFSFAQVRNMHYREDGTEFEFSLDHDAITAKWPLLGKTNILNALAAASAASGFGISIDSVKRAFQKMKSLPGRYESVICSPHQNFRIIVDYAHTPIALEELCSFYKNLAKGKLIVVFGSTGGGRDKEKRPKMGEVAAKYCDIVIVTDDDPYEEDRMSIIEQISSGIKNKKEGESLFKIVGRREAIEKGLSLCEKGDTLLIAGKGCEQIWVVGKENIPWDDRKVVCELFIKMAITK